MNQKKILFKKQFFKQGFPFRFPPGSPVANEFIIRSYREPFSERIQSVFYAGLLANKGFISFSTEDFPENTENYLLPYTLNPKGKPEGLMYKDKGEKNFQIIEKPKKKFQRAFKKNIFFFFELDFYPVINKESFQKNIFIKDSSLFEKPFNYFQLDYLQKEQLSNFSLQSPFLKILDQKKNSRGIKFNKKKISTLQKVKASAGSPDSKSKKKVQRNLKFYLKVNSHFFFFSLFEGFIQKAFPEPLNFKRPSKKNYTFIKGFIKKLKQVPSIKAFICKPKTIISFRKKSHFENDTSFYEILTKDLLGHWCLLSGKGFELIQDREKADKFFILDLSLYNKRERNFIFKAIKEKLDIHPFSEDHFTEDQKKRGHYRHTLLEEKRKIYIPLSKIPSWVKDFLSNQQKNFLSSN